MKLDRDKNSDGRGKYALLKLRQLEAHEPQATFGSNEVTRAIETLDKAGLIEWGLPNTEGEFFVIKLRDKYAAHALNGYASAVYRDDGFDGDCDYFNVVKELAQRAGAHSPFCKRPD